MDSDRVIRYLQDPLEARMFVFFLLQERIRHMKDIAAIDATLDRIHKQFHIPINPEAYMIDPTQEVWTDVA